VTKGGSESITIDNNRFELKNEGVAVKLGGSTEKPFFRFWPGQSGYEAKNITVSNNTVIHSRAAVSYVNISEGGRVNNNLIYQSGTKIARILDEAHGEGNTFDTSNGVFSGNTIIFDNQLVRDNPVNDDSDISSNTKPGTFTFSNNKWFNIQEPGGLNAVGQVLTNLPGAASGNAYGVDPQACGAFKLTSGQWRQISLPCEPQGENAKIFNLFADDIGDGSLFGNYGTDWVVYRYDTTRGEYEEMGVDAKLNQGEGYWIIQVRGGDKTLSMPADSLPIAEGGEPGCLPLERGCFNIPMATKSSAVQWNMIGYPYKTSQQLSKVRVLTASAPCGSPGCNLDAAENKGIVHNKFWTYESGYKQLGTGDSLDSWGGYWSPTLKNAHGKKQPILRFQQP
jgi:hypothetical protein